ncbi:macrolide 2'-phosphotransferase [Fontibacillus sp. BL9]|uniref:macrolide 2'-phosphotransferase n=1 Tax=Fontibacillus sp. BL9 TaxID=3389971 RepID=UPI00397DA152
MTNNKSSKQELLKRDLISLALEYGLLLNSEDVEINESGMDFVVAFAKEEDGTPWVLRKPRRSDVWERAENERKVLNFICGKLAVSVPEWRIATPELIAYPLLSGNPVAVVDPAAGGYAWTFEQAALSDAFFDSLAEALAGLHGLDLDSAAKAGLRIKNPYEARQSFESNIREISEVFEIPEKLKRRWEKWLATDSYWPDHSVLIHGDLHPPHILVDETQRVTGMIDWTEAEFADPGKDFVIFYALFGQDGLRDLLRRYERFGGTVWPRMHEHVAEQWAAYPALVAKFALTTGAESDKEMARGMLAQWEV